MCLGRPWGKPAPKGNRNSSPEQTWPLIRAAAAAALDGPPARGAGIPPTTPRPGGTPAANRDGLGREGGVMVTGLNCDGNLPTPPARGTWRPAQPASRATDTKYAQTDCSYWHRCVFKTASLVHKGDTQVGDSLPSALPPFKPKPSEQRAIQEVPGLAQISLLPEKPAYNNKNRKTFICFIPAAGCSY